jgi:hypothetical protein
MAYTKPNVAASVSEVVNRTAVNSDADSDLPVVAAVAEVVVAGVELYTVVTSS